MTIRHMLPASWSVALLLVVVLVTLSPLNLALATNSPVEEQFPQGLRLTPSPPSAWAEAAAKPDYAMPPLTVECWARLAGKQGFNILGANEPKESATHWELYTFASTGKLAVFLPGYPPDGVQTERDVVAGKWHYFAMTFDGKRVRLFVDAREEASGQVTRRSDSQPIVGGLTVGKAASRSAPDDVHGCDGVGGEVRVSKIVRPISQLPATPLATDADTIGLWHFNELTANTAPLRDYWSVEDPKTRRKLPLYKIIPAAKPEELTPANGNPGRETFLNWHRSHGDNGGARYSALDQINRGNVTNLEVAWTYHSNDGDGNLQCNPIIVHGVMFAPTPGKHLVAVNAATGAELWRFKPEGRPAFRGLTYWPGRDGASERIMFCAGQYLYALNPTTGQPVADFGQHGRVLLPGHAQGDFGAATAAPAIFERTIIVPGFEKDVWAFDAVTGEHRWTFHTVPHPGEFGYDTWDRPENYAANCWGGMALDEVRGIAYITTGSPKDNFIGVWHRGRNLFANCVIALDACTGKRLWHFQEIRHDIWDLDIPAPPNLTTITRAGRRVDVVAAVTKIGNTLLLDRVTGKPIFPFRLRRAPASDLPGEEAWPYQPDVQLPEPFAKLEFAATDITDRSEEATDYVRGRFKSATTGWFRPFSDGKMNLYFGIHGGAEWTGACVDPATSRLYVSANHIPWLISVFRDDDPPDDPHAPKTRGQLVFEQTCAACHGTNRVGFGTCPPLRGLRHRLTDDAVVSQIRNGKNSMPANPSMSEQDLKALVDFLMLRDRPLPPAAARTERPRYSYNGYPKFLDQEGYPGCKPPWGTLNCIDLNTGKLLWTVPLGEYPELTAQGVKTTGTENFGGPIVTAGGLVFCAGTRDSKIRAFDKDTGAELWSARLPWVGSAPPATCQADGRQFVVVPATGGGKLGTPTGDAYVAFALRSPGGPTARNNP